MNLESYHVFLTVVEEGQISKAAKRLFVTQSAVSQTIAQLEANLECRLFERTPKGVKLTYSGRLFYDEISEGFRHLNIAESLLMDVKKLKKGEITIGAGDSVCSHFLLDRLEIYHKSHPEIKVHVYNKTSSQVMELLGQGAIDMGFVNLPFEKRQDVEVVHVMALQDCFVASPSYPLDWEKTYRLEEVLRHPLIALEEGTNMRKYLEKVALQESVRLDPTYEVGSADLLLRFAAKNFGIAFVTKEFCRREIDQEEVKVLKVETSIPKRSIGMIKLKNQELSYAAKSFYDELAREGKG